MKLHSSLPCACPDSTPDSEVLQVPFADDVEPDPNMTRRGRVWKAR